MRGPGIGILSFFLKFFLIHRQFNSVWPCRKSLRYGQICDADVCVCVCVRACVCVCVSQTPQRLICAFDFQYLDTCMPTCSSIYLCNCTGRSIVPALVGDAEDGFALYRLCYFS